MNEEITIPFYNDLLFKYFISNNDAESNYLLKTIIEGVTPLRCEELFIMNSELIPLHFRKKKAVLDVVVKTDTGEIVNIEVQAYDLFDNISKRFQYYSFKNVVSQVDEGDDYNEIKAFYQIVFYHEYDYEHHELIQEYSRMNTKYHDNKGSLIFEYYIFMKEIKDIVKEKGRENLNVLEEFVYLVENGRNCDKIDLTKVGKIMKKKYDKFTEDETLRYEALSIEKFQFQQRLKQRNYEKTQAALNKTQQALKEKEISEQKLKVEVEYEKNKAKEKAKSRTIKFYQKKYPESDIQWLENLTEEQYDEIFDRLLNDESLDDLKG